ncbi:MAG: 2-succinyl-5-enolpyruvyl-6-hydroxy-3-cyclohexene-1-carboxylic-acid synthase [Bacteroides sp.]|jgi:2-succinyl-5-enolpyruvyl-6-hydroxy-3-cyclohexene-1-carboxylate synthase|nr:2-succinyl-5-enolpyruvyl-6-hydroxy-3-cyclohexene-1-carboxylic-acid synthase [Bacteroides sp.]
MYSDKRNILQLVALMKAHHITTVVLCPGSRNVPIVHTLAAHPSFTCYSVTDERSAGYFAIGLALREKAPVAVCCTSGTALLNLHSAVAEAFYQQVPLVVISADRPAAWIGQMDGQTIPQPGVFHDLVKKSVNLPEVQNETDEWYCNRLINEALLETRHHVCGPVHINVIVSEPLFGFIVKELPEVRVITRYQGMDVSTPDGKVLIERMKGYRKRMIIAGQTTLPGDKEKGRFENTGRVMEPLCGQFAVLTEHIGNPFPCESLLRNFDAAIYAMSDQSANQMAPDLLITYGGHVVSKRLKQFIRQHPPKEHWHVSSAGEVVDLYGSLTTIIEMEPADFIKEIACVTYEQASEYPQLWKNSCESIPEPMFAYSAMSVIGELFRKLPVQSALHLANSSAIRYAQLYPLPSSVEVFCNRGVNGIDGSLSAAVGYAAASSQSDEYKLNFVLIGDLSFFYDMNALWNGHISPNLRILLINNGGGEIFHTLPGLEASDVSHRFITAVHQTSAKGWAGERGFAYYRVEDETQLEKAMEVFTQPEKTDSPLLLEVFTAQDVDTRLLKAYYHQLKDKNRYE